MKSRIALPLLGLLVLAGILVWLSDPGPRPQPDATSPGAEPLEHRGDAPTLIGAERISVGLSSDPKATVSPTAAAPSPEHEVAMSTTRGRILDATTGAGIANAEVRALVGDDPWGLREKSESIPRVRSAADGTYELKFPLPNGEKQLVFTVLARGYRTPHARTETPQEGERRRERGMGRGMRMAAPGDEVHMDFRLLPGLDVGGIVVDSEGKPLPDVHIIATANTESSTSYLEFPVTDAAGRFRVHDLPTLAHRRTGTRGTLDFDHPEHEAARVDDVYALTAGERSALRIVMPRGLTLSGTLRHANGDPARDVFVAAFAGESNTKRRGACTDEEGAFVMRGLAPGALVLRAHSGARLEVLRMELNLLRSQEDLELRLAVAPLSSGAPRADVLGLEVVVLPPEARKEFELYKHHALMITRIGDGVPEGLRERVRVGDILWDVGGVDCDSVRDVMRAIVDRADWQRKRAPDYTPRRYTVGFVLGMRRPDLDGTYTGSMTVPLSVVETYREHLRAHPAPEGD